MGKWGGGNSATLVLPSDAHATANEPNKRLLGVFVLPPRVRISSPSSPITGHHRNEARTPVRVENKKEQKKKRKGADDIRPLITTSSG